jgi:hypothetical protein
VATVTGVAAALAALVDPLWRVLRLGVTLVHELGHAFVGMLVGRRFTGFVLRGDMSGHAVTVGPPRGIGRLVTTWAGYPMPGVVALGLVAAASQRYAAPLLTALLVGLLITVPRVRSLLTAIVVGLTTAALGCLWWWGTAAVQAQVLIGIALILLVGGWRHLGAVASATTAGSDRHPAWWYLTELPQGRNAARAGELFQVRGVSCRRPGRRRRRTSGRGRTSAPR